VPSVLLGVGDYRFGINTAAYESYRRQSEWRWGQAERIGRQPAMQYLGPGGDTITLQGVVYPHYRGGLGQVDAMRREAGKGQPLSVVTGRGDSLGRWCIVSVEESKSSLWQDGAPRRQEFTLVLKAYGEDGAAGSEALLDGGDLQAGGDGPWLPFGDVVAAVSSIASEVESVGLAVAEAAQTVVGMADQLVSIATGAVTDLAGVVLGPVLDLIELPVTELTALVNSDALGAVGRVMTAANGLMPGLREEALDCLFGPAGAERVVQVADAIRTAESVGRKWLGDD
jgi:phage protein U